MTPSPGYVERPAPSSLADVINTVLDKGLVIDVYARVSALGIELLTLDARVVISSVDTYLRFAEAVQRLDLKETQADLFDLTEQIMHTAAEAKVSGAIDSGVEKAAGAVERGLDKVNEWLKPPADRPTGGGR